MMVEKNKKEESVEIKEEVKSIATESKVEEKSPVLVDERGLLNERLTSAKAGRLESDIPQDDPFWGIRAEIQQKMHKMENE
jgi:hypothetical protein